MPSLSVAEFSVPFVEERNGGAPVAHIEVHAADETVATGAALQAAAVASSSALSELAERWRLGAGTPVEPQATDGTEVRARYRAAIDAS